jgi:hypothetical protein
MGDVHAKHNQQSRGNKGKVSKNLEKKRMRYWVLRPGQINEGAHDFKSDPDLGKIVDQTV